MTDEAQELREAAEKAREDSSLAAVSLTMAVLAVFVAVVSLLGHRAHTEEVVLQAKSSDQWAYYQAKNIRQHEDELFVAANNGVAPDDRFRIEAGYLFAKVIQREGQRMASRAEQ